MTEYSFRMRFCEKICMLYFSANEKKFMSSRWKLRFLSLRCQPCFNSSVFLSSGSIVILQK